MPQTLKDNPNGGIPCPQDLKSFFEMVINRKSGGAYFNRYIQDPPKYLDGTNAQRLIVLGLYQTGQATSFSSNDNLTTRKSKAVLLSLKSKKIDDIETKAADTTTVADPNATNDADLVHKDLTALLNFFYWIDIFDLSASLEGSNSSTFDQKKMSEKRTILLIRR